jgi:hypothetical protein
VAALARSIAMGARQSRVRKMASVAGSRFGDLARCNIQDLRMDVPSWTAKSVVWPIKFKQRTTNNLFKGAAQITRMDAQINS